jgi:caffeoyl-CoA O-methyltransferase
MEILPDVLQAYLDQHVDAEPALLQKVNRDTYVRMLKPHMLSGHYQGRLLAMLSKLINPKTIVELGTFTGYATLCLAEGLADDGVIHTIEADAELEENLRQTFKLTNVEKKIKLHIGPAAQVLADFEPDNIDLAFIDADKKNNFLYFQLLVEKIRPGGLIIIDNVLWKGKVYGEANDADTKLIRELNERITADDRVEKLILPVRDGILLIRKK